MHSHPDSATIELARQGDAHAWESIVRIYRDPLLRFLERLMPSEIRGWMDAQDLLNDTCFEAYRRLADFRSLEPDSIYRWLATIARHQLLNVVKAQRREKRGGNFRRLDGKAAGDTGHDPLVELLQELAIYERTPSRSAMRHELRLALEKSVAKLSPPLREAIRLRHMSGLSVKEIAATMSRTERAVHQLCNRALHELRSDLQSASFFV